MEHFPVPHDVSEKKSILGRLWTHPWFTFCVYLFLASHQLTLRLLNPDVETFQVATWHLNVTESSYRKECS